MLQIHLLSFEGPDAYSRAGGIASRTVGLAEALCQSGHQTHVWFVGDPAAPGHEVQGNLHLHRWCQWLSAYHPQGVYDGEAAKAHEYASSLPPFLWREVLGPHLQSGQKAVVIAEEWHTAHAVLHLDYLLRNEGMRQQVSMLWNANNTFGFDKIDWCALQQATSITTVSRYMRHIMQGLGVDPLVLPNGLAYDCFVQPEQQDLDALRGYTQTRTFLAKIARFDPDKHWLLAVDTIGALKAAGHRPLLLARGGIEAHGEEVLRRATATGLRVVDRKSTAAGIAGVLDALQHTDDADIINLQSHIDAPSRRVILGGAQAVLCNSVHEPFGLVGLETMAAGGIACTGCSGEDYAVSGCNALVWQSADPKEFVGMLERFAKHPEAETAMRRAGRQTAQNYAWPTVLAHDFLPRLALMGAT